MVVRATMDRQHGRRPEWVTRLIAMGVSASTVSHIVLSFSQELVPHLGMHVFATIVGYSAYTFALIATQIQHQGLVPRQLFPASLTFSSPSPPRFQSRLTSYISGLQMTGSG